MTSSSDSVVRKFVYDHGPSIAFSLLCAIVPWLIAQPVMPPLVLLLLPVALGSVALAAVLLVVLGRWFFRPSLLPLYLGAFAILVSLFLAFSEFQAYERDTLADGFNPVMDKESQTERHAARTFRLIGYCTSTALWVVFLGYVVVGWHRHYPPPGWAVRIVHKLHEVESAATDIKPHPIDLLKYESRHDKLNDPEVRCRELVEMLRIDD